MVQSFHSEGFPSSNTGTFRKADTYGRRIFLKSWVNLGIDWESPKPGEPCVMLNAMKQDGKGMWVDSRWLKLARDHLKTGTPIGIVAAAANSTAKDKKKAWAKLAVKTWSNPAGGKGKKWFPLGRYIVRDVGSAPAGAFSRASKPGRDEALPSFRQHAIKSLDWSIKRIGLFPNADGEVLKADAEAGDFMERLGKVLDNSNEEQHLTYTIVEYHSPYDPKELEEAVEERRTGVKKKAMKEARAATAARIAAEQVGGTWIPKKRRGKKKAVDFDMEGSEAEGDSGEH